MTDCKYRVAAGNYYSSLPWNGCKKIPNSPVVGECGMCYVDTGVECPFKPGDSEGEPRMAPVQECKEGTVTENPDWTCPMCSSTNCTREEVDIGVGTQYGPWSCLDCNFSQDDDLRLEYPELFPEGE